MSGLLDNSTDKTDAFGVPLTHLPLDKMAAIFKCIFVNVKVCILVQISLHFVPKHNIASDDGLRRIDDKPLSEPNPVRFTDAYIGGDELNSSQGSNTMIALVHLIFLYAMHKIILSMPLFLSRRKCLTIL